MFRRRDQPRFGQPDSISVSGAVDSDYNITYVVGTLTVNPAPLTIVADNQSKVYGAAIPTLTVSYIGLVNGDTASTFSNSPNTAPSLATSATAASHVAGGPYAITVSGAIDSDYSISYVDGLLTVDPAPLTITPDNQTSVYGGPLPTLTVSYSGFVNGDTSANLSIQPDLSTTATIHSHVSGNPFSINASGASDPDYDISYVSGTLTVTPAPLTITANNQSKAYGAALPTLTVSYTGFVNGDTAATLTYSGNTPPSISTVPATSGVGSYAITPSAQVIPTMRSLTCRVS